MARLKRDVLSAQVVKEVGGWILTGRISPGETIPTEQALSEQFGVSKTVVREAGKILAAKGLVSIRQGIGTSVNSKEVWNSFDPMVLLHSQQGASFDDLMQLRRILEPEVAAMACARSHDRAFLRELEELIEKGGRVTAVEDHVRYDLAFHQALADATGNQFLVIMMNSIGQFLKASREALFHVSGAVNRSIEFHHVICEAIARHDLEGSRDAMRCHLQQVESDYKRLVETTKGPDPTDAHSHEGHNDVPI